MEKKSKFNFQKRGSFAKQNMLKGAREKKKKEKEKRKKIDKKK